MMFRWDCGAGSLLPIEATRPGLPQDFSISIFFSITQPTSTFSSHQFKGKSPCFMSSILSLNLSMQAYHKAEAMM
jgi:hypothetical protein